MAYNMCFLFVGLFFLIELKNGFAISFHLLKKVA